MNCKYAVAVLEHPLVNGVVTFHQCENKEGTFITYSLRGEPNTILATHIHAFGDMRDGCKSMGPHWNPDNTTHGSIFNKGQPRHRGDTISNLFFDEEGNFNYEYYDPLVYVDGILGRSLVIHDGIDDLGLGEDAESLKTGNAGSRITCAVIGLANPEYS